MLLVALFSISLFTPLLAADQRSNLPICCRRDGKHHCSMPAPAADHDGLEALQARCSFYRGAGSFFTGPQTVTVAVPAGIQTLQPCAANIADHVDSRALSAVSGAPDSRGPPSFLE